jgi:hypothetical protein
VAPVEDRSENRLFAVLCVLAAVVVLVPLVLWLGFRPTPAIEHQSSTPLTTPTPTTSLPQPSVFTPAGTAPTSTDCRDALSFPCYAGE